jgi:hypothetical protein
MRCHRAAGFVGAAALVLVCGTAFGQTDAAAKPADADALRGPSIKESPKPVSLVKRDMTGKFERLDARPEQAALDLLGLTAEQRKAPDKVLADRFGAVTKVLQANQDLFLKIQQGRQGGVKPEELRPQMREMRQAAAPLLENALEDQVANALPEEKRAECRKLVEEYKRVMAAEEPGGYGQGAGTGGGGGRGRGRQTDAEKPAGDIPDAPKGDSKPEAKTEPKADGPIPPRVEMNLLLREMGRALNAIVVERKEQLATLLKAVDATPEQEGQIQAIVRDFASKKKDEAKLATGEPGSYQPTPEDRRANWEKIMAVLTPEQRRKAVEYRRSN